MRMHYAYTPILCQAQTPMHLRFNQDMSSLGQRIKDHRKKAKLSQGSLGGKVGLDQTVISKLERGEIHETTKIGGLAKALNVDAYWLETGIGNPNPNNLQAVNFEHKDKTLVEIIELENIDRDEAELCRAEIHSAYLRVKLEYKKQQEKSNRRDDKPGDCSNSEQRRASN